MAEQLGHRYKVFLHCTGHQEHLQLEKQIKGNEKEMQEMTLNHMRHIEHTLLTCIASSRTIAAVIAHIELKVRA